MAREFLGASHTVVLVARDAERLTRAIATLPAGQRDRCQTLVCDVASPGAPAIIDDGLRQMGCYPDVLINNAAMGLSGPFTRQTSEQLDALIALNIAALTRLTRHALPGMIARGQGGIINVASLGGYVPGPHQAAYYASKAYVLSLSEAIASETSGLGVRIHSDCARSRGDRLPCRYGRRSSPTIALLLPELSAERVARSGYRAFTTWPTRYCAGVTVSFIFCELACDATTRFCSAHRMAFKKFSAACQEMFRDAPPRFLYGNLFAV